MFTGLDAELVAVAVVSSGTSSVSLQLHLAESVGAD